VPNEQGLFEALGEVVDLDPLLRGVLILKISEPSAAKSLAMPPPLALTGEDCMESSNLKDSGIPTRGGRRRGEGPASAVLGATGEIGALVEADDT